jgi:hypothetical protein
VRGGGRRAAAVLGGDGRAGGGGAPPPVRPVVVEGVLEAARGEAAVLLLLLLLLRRHIVSVGETSSLDTRAAGAGGQNAVLLVQLWLADPVAVAFVDGLGIEDGSCQIALGMLTMSRNFDPTLFSL